ncbi:Uncharacterised protein [Serratia marcescens]|nr:Uncharacterised protein [Serratia marcescens]
MRNQSSYGRHHKSHSGRIHCFWFNPHCMQFGIPL